MKKIQHMKINKELLILFGWSIVTLLVGSKNSPLFILNDWGDLNAFLTMGKSWAHGLIPYKDLFEQKGPALYFIFNIASRISSSYFGVYLLEVLFFTASLYLIYKIARFFINETTSLVFCMFSSVLLTLNPYFRLGGSAEEFAFPFILYGIFLIFEFQENEESLKASQYFISGLFFSILFWIKFTMIGSYLGFYLPLAIVLIIHAKWQELMKAIIYSLLGFLSLSVVITTYFSMNQALDKLFHVYFYSNIFLYQEDIDITILGKIMRALSEFIKMVKGDPLLFSLMFIGLISLILSRRILKNNNSLFIFFAAYFSLLISTFFGGNFWPYYCLILIPFICISLLPMLTYIKDVKLNQLQVSFLGILAFVLILGSNQNIVESKLLPHNPTISTSSEDFEPAQVVFGDIIKKENNPTLLNYGELDMGFYQAANVIPSTYFFEIQNISDVSLPEMRKDQADAIRKKKVMFVVTRSQNGDEEYSLPKDIDKNYDFIARHLQTFEGEIRDYHLYKVKP